MDQKRIVCAAASQRAMDAMTAEGIRPELTRSPGSGTASRRRANSESAVRAC
jgi:hypothetical protein